MSNLGCIRSLVKENIRVLIWYSLLRMPPLHWCGQKRCCSYFRKIWFDRYSDLDLLLSGLLIHAISLCFILSNICMFESYSTFSVEWVNCAHWSLAVTFFSPIRLSAESSSNGHTYITNGHARKSGWLWLNLPLYWVMQYPFVLIACLRIGTITITIRTDIYFAIADFIDRLWFNLDLLI